MFRPLPIRPVFVGPLPAPITPPVTPPVTPTVTSPPVTTQAIQIMGTVEGSYSAVAIDPAAGVSYMFSGSSATVSPFGSVMMTGGIQSSAGASDVAQGKLVLSNASGSVTLSLTGSPQKRFAQVPSFFSYTITDSTGQFQGTTGSGTMVLTLAPNPTMNPTLNQSGRFTITFTKTPPPGAPLR